MLKALSLLLLVGTTRGEFTVLERRDSPPSGFSRVGPSPPDTVLNLRLALTQNNISGLHDTVYEVSAPGNSHRPESAMTNDGSGGHLWGRLFQHFYDKVVSEYLNAINATDASPFNISGRAVSDVSALAHSPYIFQGQTILSQAGTVFSATIFASMIALLNNERIAAGKSSLGFLNPLIYQNPNAFNDFANGQLKPGCDDSNAFNATVGWDPVTGFGSPSYAKLREICQKI
ncbi:peptidase S8/S53 domain-containing protein [Mycena metata]|uniref:Peptidase S8/S53 domain-containing protein n=1 Tax=Mycena metata TaxID=1033252 RepID=A0AAD7JSZ0_9AGAR|nr:peptidase S8/S53 domain-containing protein [Mycena metata]